MHSKVVLVYKQSLLRLASVVSSLGDSCFEGCNNAGFTQIALPAGVQSIGVSSFKDCTDLSAVTGSVQDGSSLTSVGENASQMG